MRNKVILIASIFCISTSVFSQSLTLSPNPQKNGICLGFNTTFTVNGIPSNCSYFSLSLQSGSNQAYQKCADAGNMVFAASVTVAI